MFRIYYNIRIEHKDKILFDPIPIYKIYNYIKANIIDLNSININDLILVNGIQQRILAKDNTGIFIAPGIEISDPLTKLSSVIVINNNTYNLTFDPYDTAKDQLLIGNIVLYGTNYDMFHVNDNIRLISDNYNIVYFKNTNITQIYQEYGIYLFNTNYHVIYIENNNEILDWLNKANNLYIHSIDTCKHNINMELGLRIFGGIPYRDDSVATNQYKIIVEDKTAQSSVTKTIPQFTNYKFDQKHLYEISILDTLDNVPLLINDELANMPLVIDLTNPEVYIPETPKNSPIGPLSSLFAPILG